MKLHAVMPFAADMNYGRECNATAALIPDGDWFSILDHDMMFTTREWHKQLTEAIAFRPDAGVFVAVTNRIDAHWQRAQEADRENHDIGVHTRIGVNRLRKRTLLDISNTKGFGGVMMCLSKATWQAVGGFKDGMLCVDHGLHFALQTLGKPAFLLESLYVYHRRRAFIGELPGNVPIANGCPCRGPEEDPTVRIALP